MVKRTCSKDENHSGWRGSIKGREPFAYQYFGCARTKLKSFCFNQWSLNSFESLTDFLARNTLHFSGVLCFWYAGVSKTVRSTAGSGRPGKVRKKPPRKVTKSLPLSKGSTECSRSRVVAVSGSADQKCGSLQHNVWWSSFRRKVDKSNV